MQKLFTILFLTAFLLLANLNTHAQAPEKPRVILVAKSDSSQVLSYPLNVMNVIEAKCLGCHSPEGKSDDAKEALQWIVLQSMGATDAVAVLDEIAEVLEKGEMPPAKIVEKYPSLKMTEEETKTLQAWVDGTMKGLMGE